MTGNRWLVAAVLGWQVLCEAWRRVRVGWHAARGVKAAESPQAHPVEPLGETLCSDPPLSRVHHYVPALFWTTAVFDRAGLPLGRMTLASGEDPSVFTAEFVPAHTRLRDAMGFNRLYLPSIPVGGRDTVHLAQEASLRALERELRHRFPAHRESASTQPAPRHEPQDAQPGRGAAKLPYTGVPRVPPLASPDPAPRRGKQVQAEASHEGTLVSWGLQDRTFADEDGAPEGRRRGAARQSRQFAVDIELDSGATHRIWGADLERALDESGARAGQRVRVQQLGSVEVALPSRTGQPKRTGFKKMFRVEVVT